MPKAPNYERHRAIVSRFRAGETPRQIADDLGIRPSGIHNLLTKLGAKTARRERVQPSSAEPDLPRVNRDPCPRCGVRADVGCDHSGARLTMGAFV